MSRVFTLSIFALSVVVFGYCLHLSVIGIAVTALTFAIMATSGMVVLQILCPKQESALAVIVFGSVIGLVLGRFVLVGIGLLSGPGPLGPIAAMNLLVIGSVGLVLRYKKSVLPVWTGADTAELLCIMRLLAVLNCILAVAYWGVGQSTPSGHAYVPYFDRDYMNHVALTAELARGLPPQNPYCAGERLHYYWLFHSWPAAIKSIAGVSAAEAVKCAILPTVCLFVAVLALWMRLYIFDRAVRYFAIGISLFACSYIGDLFLVKMFAPYLIRQLPVVSSAEYSFLTHSWFRDCLYEPHAITALTLLLVVLCLDRLWQSTRECIALGCVVGFGFGAMAVTDAFVGMVGLLYFAIINCVYLLRDRSSRLYLFLAALTTVSVLVAAVALGAFPVGERSVYFAIHPAAKLAPAYLVLEMGPLVVLAVIGGFMLIFQGNAARCRHLFILAALALLLGFALTVPVEPNIALRKSLKVVQIPLVFFCATALVGGLQSTKRGIWVILGLLITLPGVTSLFTDMAFYLDKVKDRFPPTTYISDDELDLLDWARCNLPPDAVLQVADQNRLFGSSTQMVIESLAERRTFYGNDEMPRMFHVPSRVIQQRKEMLQNFYAAKDVPSMLLAVCKLPHVYLLVDDRLVDQAALIRKVELQGRLRRVYQRGHFVLMQVVVDDTFESK